MKNLKKRVAELEEKYNLVKASKIKCEIHERFDDVVVGSEEESLKFELLKDLRVLFKSNYPRSCKELRDYGYDVFDILNYQTYDPIDMFNCMDVLSDLVIDLHGTSEDAIFVCHGVIIEFLEKENESSLHSFVTAEDNDEEAKEKAIEAISWINYAFESYGLDKL